MTHSEIEADRHLRNAKDCMEEAARFSKYYKPETAADKPMKCYHVEGYHLADGLGSGIVCGYNLYIAGLIVARVEISAERPSVYAARCLCENVFRNKFGSAQQLIPTGSRRIEA